MASINDRIRELTQPMLRQKLYVVMSRGKGLDLKPHLVDHLEWMISIERQGKVFASGPFAPGTSGDGLTILRAADMAEAREIMTHDPFVINGIRTIQIHEWTVMEGSLNLNVFFSNRSVEVS